MAEPWLNILSEDPEHVPNRDYNRVKREYEWKMAAMESRVEEMLELVMAKLKRSQSEKLPV